MIKIGIWADEDSYTEYVEAVLVIGRHYYSIDREECGADEISLEQLDEFIAEWRANAKILGLKFDVSGDIKNLRQEIEEAQA